MAEHRFIIPAQVDSSPRVGDGDRKRDGRWLMNAGAMMTTEIEGLNDGEPIQVIVDMASCRFAKQRIHALSEHEKKIVLGYWENGECAETGISADLYLMELADDKEAFALPETIRYKAMIRNGVPVEVSVGVHLEADGRYEEVLEDTVTVNGRTYEKGNFPLYILRNGVIHESSLCTFGADSGTGQIAASQTITSRKEATMSDKLKSMLGKFAEKHHGLVARFVADGADEAEITAAVAEAEQAEVIAAKDKEIETLKGQLTAKDERIASLEATIAEGPKKTESNDDGVLKASKGSDKGIRFGATEGNEGKGNDTALRASVKTMTQAIQFCRKADPSLKGIPLRRKARAEFPGVSDA